MTLEEENEIALKAFALRLKVILKNENDSRIR
jgi:hypothetical protein